MKPPLIGPSFLTDMVGFCFRPKYAKRTNLLKLKESPAIASN